MKFNEVSYKLHEENYESLTRGSERGSHAQTWREGDTVDAWRHRRMYQHLDGVIEAFPGSTWLTVGDGRFGSDAHYLYKKGLKVLATDVSDALLREAVEEEYIEQCQKENAEALTFKDEEYDFVLCKESFHHFPRPMMALYEMLRVCKRGVILMEPNDSHMATGIATKLKYTLKMIVKKILGRSATRHMFETVGNYVYTLSRWEIEKVALGMNYRTVAFSSLNDYYVKGVEYEKAVKASKTYRKVKRCIWLRDLLCKMRLADYGMVVSVIFKGGVDEGQLSILRKKGYKVVHMPKNPYINNELKD